MKLGFHRFFLSLALCTIHSTHCFALNERIVYDPNTGIALFGYDPLSYFVNVIPKQGSAKYELYQDGVSWRFYSAGNKRVFEKSPQSYAPQFGGHDPVSLANNLIALSDPRFYIVYKKKLFLFATAASRVAFSVEPEYYFKQAQNNWETLKLNLATQ